MTLSSIWIVSADQSHQIQDAAEAAASYSAAVQALEEAGLSQSAQANSNIAIDLGMLEQEETVDLSQLAVQAVQLQQEEEARQAEAARQANREAARRTGRQAARQALLDAYDGAMAARQITVYAAPSDSAASLRTLRQGKVARLNDVTEDGNWYQITFSGTTGYVRADGCQTVQYSDYAGTSAVKSAREDLVDYAKSFLGTRYVWGGASPSGFDCSGFTMDVDALDLIQSQYIEQVVVRTIDHLSERRKEIFRLSREENLTNKEIAEMLGISVRTVEKSIELTLKEIRKVIPS